MLRPLFEHIVTSCSQTNGLWREFEPWEFESLRDLIILPMASSQLSTYAALIVGSLCIGYWAGVGSTLPITRSSNLPSSPELLEPVAPENRDDESESEDDIPENDLSKVEPSADEDCKLVLVVRTDLGMTSGKIAAQCSHATLACYKALSKTNPKLLRHWERTGQTKIAVRCASEDELLLLQATAQSLNVCARSIQDAGRTQIAAGSRTVLGVGPAPVRLVNQVTGKLKLL
ncbi:PTH2-domain-containing protein [Sistotremastrum niveocremeum HHB9708]|uniref:peptidyl-tRNA hydrolase n=1 Tax=Sistotremastrum niveocremeum HHB9708 TaxID=1314777 RepID=A0A164UJB4_9AGAM|nr:PTH2-domain-containing protein [Sistotremastrum niveocremeum HHB9708]